MGLYATLAAILNKETKQIISNRKIKAFNKHITLKHYKKIKRSK